VKRFTATLLQAQTIQKGHLDKLKQRINTVEISLTEIEPLNDQRFFMDFNIRPFFAPGDWAWEPCATHYDTVIDHMHLLRCPNDAEICLVREI
jgi:formin-binding protein 1